MSHITPLAEADNSQPSASTRPESIDVESHLEDDDSDFGSIISGHDDTEQLELRKVRSQDDSDGDESEKEHSRPVTRIGSNSKEFTAEEERDIIRKFDRRLVLFIALLYMLSFLDRSNIGNARIAGLDESLSLSSSQYSWLLTAFYITYIAFEWMTLLFRIIPPHIYISVIVLCWGLIASLQSLCTSFAALVVLRAFLGIAEAAFTGVPLYLTFFYKRSELAYRVGIFISAAPLAISFASSLAWVIVKASSHGPIEPWRALFLVEGFPSIITAAFAFYFIPDSPATTRYLSPRERRVAKLRLQFDSPPTSSTTPAEKPHGISPRQILTTLADPTAYLTALMFFSANISFSSLPVFLPTILADMSFSPLASQALAAPPYLCAFAAVLLISRVSDALPNSRAYCICVVSFLSSASYLLNALAGLLHSRLGPTPTLILRFASVYGAACGFFPAVTLILTWTLNNQATATGKGTGLTIVQVIGQLGPLVGVHLFPKNQAPYYVPGMLVCAGFMLGVGVLALALRFYLMRLNKKSEGAGGGEYEMVETRERRAEGEGLVRMRPSGQRREPFRFML